MHLTTAMFRCLTLLCLIIIFVNVVGVVGVTRRTLRHAKLEKCYLARKRPAGKTRVSNIDRFKELKQLPVLYKIRTPSIRDSTSDKLQLLDQGYYVTLYDTEHKLPVYSAYTLDFRGSNECNRIDGWIVNPLLKKTEQPKVADYNGIEDKNLHRGHLFPQFYNYGENQKRFTNLITNIALQYKDFNTQAWHRMEKEVRIATNVYCNFGNAKRYFVTGVIPSNNPNDWFHNINIPEYFWTAVCCDSSVSSDVNKQSSGWSFAYMVKNVNVAKSTINMFLIEDFLNEPIIAKMFTSIFEKIGKVEHCLFSLDQAVQVVSKIKESDNQDWFIMHKTLFSLLTKKLSGVKRLRPE